jgi:hypothetical protein
MSNGGSPNQHDDRKTVEHKAPKAAAGKPVATRTKKPAVAK